MLQRFEFCKIRLLYKNKLYEQTVHLIYIIIDNENCKECLSGKGFARSVNTLIEKGKLSREVSEKLLGSENISISLKAVLLEYNHNNFQPQDIMSDLD